MSPRESIRDVSDASVLATLPPGWDRRKCYLCSRPLAPRAVGLYTRYGDGMHTLFACLCKHCVERIGKAITTAATADAIPVGDRCDSCLRVVNADDIEDGACSACHREARAEAADCDPRAVSS